MFDRIIKATNSNKEISINFVDLTQTCQEAINIHDLKDNAAEALSKGLIGGALLASTLKNSDDSVSLIVKGNGPAKGLTVTAQSSGTIKGYLHNSKAKADSIGDLLGTGYLIVTKDIGLKQPYTGQIPLVSGEIAEDITAYFAESEQIISSCGIEILFDDPQTIKKAAGFLIQLLPNANFEVIDQLKLDLIRHPLPASILNKNETDQVILDKILPGFEIEILETEPIKWMCDCNEDKIQSALIAVGQKELENMIEEGENTEIVCDFCNKKYTFTVEDLKELYKKAK